ncbi:peptidoglycan-binding domain-containing protein [Streptomyces sp. NPDC055709]
MTAMQRRLYSIGLYHGYQYGTFDSDTEDSVCRFQQWATVADLVRADAPGTYGPATREALTRLAP